MGNGMGSSAAVTARCCLLLAVLGATMSVPGAAVAGYGGGGGGGGSSRVFNHVKARVRNGDLILTGPSGPIFLSIIPTPDGLRLRSSGATRVNGGSVFLAEGVTRDWKFRFVRSRAVEIDVVLEDAAAPTPTVRNVSMIGGQRSEFVLTGIDVTGKVKADFRRTQPGREATLAISDMSIGGALTVLGSSNRTELLATDVDVAGRTFVNARTRRKPTANVVSLALTRCAAGDVKLQVAAANGALTLDACTTTGVVTAKGDVDVTVFGSTLGGDVSVTTGFDVQFVRFEDSTVDGTATISTGQRDDSIDLLRSSFGMLDVRGGPGDDVLLTSGVSAGPGSRFVGSKGARDAWWTDGDAGMLDTDGVEETGPIPVE